MKYPALAAIHPDIQPLTVDGKVDPLDKRNWGKLEELAKKNPRLALQIWSLDEGLMDPKDFTARMGQKGAAMSLVRENFDPLFNEGAFKNRQDAQADFQGKGKVGQALVNNNTLIQHANQLRQYYENLKNGSFMGWNAAKNMWQRYGMGSGDVMDTKRQIINVIGEMSKLVKGGEASDSLMNSYLATLNENSSPDEAQKAIDGILEAAEARRDSNINQYQAAMGRTARFLPVHEMEKAEKAAAMIREKPITGSERFIELQKKGAKSPDTPPSGDPLEGRTISQPGKPTLIRQGGKWVEKP